MHPAVQGEAVGEQAMAGLGVPPAPSGLGGGQPSIRAWPACYWPDLMPGRVPHHNPRPVWRGSSSRPLRASSAARIGAVVIQRATTPGILSKFLPSYPGSSGSLISSHHHHHIHIHIHILIHTTLPRTSYVYAYAPSSYTTTFATLFNTRVSTKTALKLGPPPASMVFSGRPSGDKIHHWFHQSFINPRLYWFGIPTLEIPVVVPACYAWG